MRSELLEALALDIVKVVDYDLWKEVRKEDDEGLLETIVSLIEDVLDRLETVEDEDEE